MKITALLEQNIESETTATGEDLVQTAKRQKVYLAVKRVLDILVAVFAGLFLLIPLCLIGILIRLESPGPALFLQKRMGRHGKTFTIYKFRTMRTVAPSDMATRELPNSEQYITRIGSFLRRTSIDELPQLLNVLRGDMSLIGYRPVCLTETKLNEMRRQNGVFAARPGITGLAQVSGRDNIGNEEKVKYDALYVRECSLKMDLYCLIKTVAAVIDGEGVL